MLELRFIRENSELVQKKTRHRGLDDSMINSFLEVDKERRSILSELEGLRNQRKTISQEIGRLKAAQENADVLLLGGDLLPGGGKDAIVNKQQKFLQKYLFPKTAKLKKKMPGLDIFVFLGNDDTAACEELLINYEHFDYLHMMEYEIDSPNPVPPELSLVL